MKLDKPDPKKDIFAFYYHFVNHPGRFNCGFFAAFGEMSDFVKNILSKKGKYLINK